MTSLHNIDYPASSRYDIDIEKISRTTKIIDYRPTLVCKLCTIANSRKYDMCSDIPLNASLEGAPVVQSSMITITLLLLLAHHIQWYTSQTCMLSVCFVIWYVGLMSSVTIPTLFVCCAVIRLQGLLNSATFCLLCSL